MAKLREARALRDMYLNQLTETFDIGATADQNDDPKLKALFSRRFQRLSEVKIQFEKTHLSIVGLLAVQTDADYSADEGIRKQFDAYFFECDERYHRWFPPEKVPLESASPLLASPASASNHHASGIRLPKIPLRQFDGDFRQWTAFIQSFDSAIHLNMTLTKLDKFQYLLSSLSGEPLHLLKTLNLSDENYDTAYQILQNRYNDKRKLATQYWSILQKLSPLRNESAKDLRSLLDRFKESRAALQALKISDNLEDFLWFQLLIDKIDPHTRRLFESDCRDLKDFPSFQKLETFIESQCKILESVAIPKESSKNVPFDKSSKASMLKTAMVAKTGSQPACAFCTNPHLIYSCPSFAEKTPSERHAFIKQARICYNCLKTTHMTSSCPSKSTCKECNGRHHTLLHLPRSKSPVNQAPTEASGSAEGSLNACTGVTGSLSNRHVLLATLLVEICDRTGSFHKARALLDPGSQASFITTNLSRTLGLPRSKCMLPVVGLANSRSQPHGVVSTKLRPRSNKDSVLEVDLLILDNICGKLPSVSIDTPPPEHVLDIRLADPDWTRSKQIDLLLGADAYPSVILGGLISSSNSRLVAINTIFGWAVVGPIASSESPIKSLVVSVDPPLDTVIRQFWELEEPPALKQPLLSDKEAKAETSFLSGLFRTNEGRFGVRLPFSDTVPSFVDSQMIADRRWLALERRLAGQSLLRDLYVTFMKDYLEAGHMSLNLTPVESDSYFIPHHGVVKTNGETTKIRVVFDASAKDGVGMSLNDTLLPGPKLQVDIVALLLRFRSRPIVFICDIKQMYRQILVAPEHQKFQLIRFRFTPDQPIQTYRLNTVTYGVSSSPFLAIRTLLYLADQNELILPEAAGALRDSLYVDDLICGADSLDDALHLKSQLVELLRTGCFELHKWASNKTELLKDIPDPNKQTSMASFDKDSDCLVKVLGLVWDSQTDFFRFQVSIDNRPCSKRTMLSEIARIYDPLGFLAPITLLVKHLIQRLWTAGINWDDSPPPDIVNLWSRFKDTIPLLTSLQIPRYVFDLTIESPQLHAFCDASEQGYACVVYARYIIHGAIKVVLLIARSKVAPLKVTSIPRLELCGAVLLARLVSFLCQALKDVVSFEAVYAWCDSTIVLTWVKSPSSQFKTFVANRVGQIHDLIPSAVWKHVPSQDNPADMATRGILPDVLVDDNLWWAGPSWLSLPDTNWPDGNLTPSQSSDDNLLERRGAVVLTTTVVNPNCLELLLNRRSKLSTVLRALVYCSRFGLRNRHQTHDLASAITERELDRCLKSLIKHTQQQHFADEIATVRKGKLPRPPFRSLNLFIDQDGILRVGGRLVHADLPLDAKHPVLLPQKSRLTTLVVEDCHHKFLHPGLNTLHSLLRQNFWIMAPRRAIRSCLKACLPCWRTRPRFVPPLMGNLPKSRISELRAFKFVGVDYGGPFLITMSKHRGVRSTKAYICLFVCYSTKAVHLELASELSTDSFLAAFRRFMARRGRCVRVHSDCGTNFVGAARLLHETMKKAVETEAIEWHFNPPASPHFGGLWEAGIKSVKTHLARVVGQQIFSYEEFNTLLCQIESLLNSRPLYPLSSDPNDLTVLTPGHFLTLEPISTLPSFDDDTLPPTNRLKRWQLLQHLHRDFWRRWHLEYLHNLQQRPKWQTRTEPLQAGQLVILKDSSTPPSKWPLGRVIETHKGPDDVIRVASVKTARGIFKRPVVKLAALPIEE